MLAAGFGGLVFAIREPPTRAVVAPLHPWVTPERADAIIATYNAELRAELASLP